MKRTTNHLPLTTNRLPLITLLRTLFTSTFMISLIMIGGGYVGIPLARKRFVEQLGWVTEEEMADLTIISQSLPGAIAVNICVATGYKVAGVAGAMCSLLGTLLPPLLSVIIVQGLYTAFIDNPYLGTLFRGMNAVTAAIMMSVVWDMGTAALKGNRFFGIAMMTLAFSLVIFVGLNAVTVMLGCLTLSILLALALYFHRKRQQNEM